MARKNYLEIPLISYVDNNTSSSDNVVEVSALMFIDNEIAISRGQNRIRLLSRMIENVPGSFSIMIKKSNIRKVVTLLRYNNKIDTTIDELDYYVKKCLTITRQIDDLRKQTERSSSLTLTLTENANRNYNARLDLEAERRGLTSDFAMSKKYIAYDFVVGTGTFSVISKKSMYTAITNIFKEVNNTNIHDFKVKEHFNHTSEDEIINHLSTIIKRIIFMHYSYEAQMIYSYLVDRKTFYFSFSSRPIFAPQLSETKEQMLFLEKISYTGEKTKFEAENTLAAINLITLLEEKYKHHYNKRNIVFNTYAIYHDYKTKAARARMKNMTVEDYLETENATETLDELIANPPNFINSRAVSISYDVMKHFLGVAYEFAKKYGRFNSIETIDQVNSYKDKEKTNNEREYLFFITQLVKYGSFESIDKKIKKVLHAKYGLDNLVDNSDYLDAFLNDNNYDEIMEDYEDMYDE